MGDQKAAPEESEAVADIFEPVIGDMVDEELDDILPGMLEGRERIYFGLGDHPEFENRLLGWVSTLRARESGGARPPEELFALKHLLHEQRLIKTAAEIRAMRRAAIALNAELNDQPKYNLRIALNSGETLGGTLGVSGSLHYNVIGDTINVAARLESWTKSLDRDSGGFRPVCMTMATARTIDPNREWPVLSSFLHDDGVTDIQVVAVEME